VADDKRPEIKTDPGLAEAAERTRALIRGLRSRLKPDAAGPVPEPPAAATEDLERRLYDSFEGANRPEQRLPGANVPDQIRKQVIDGVVERILSAWDQPAQGGASGIQDEVVERLIARVLGQMQ
jgi:hypothetical protein